MAVQLINIGNVANDGTGDDLREAMIKINQNFEELDLRDDEQTTASNLDFGGVGIFAQKINYDLQFKALKAGTDISLESNDTAITITADGGIKTLSVTSDVNFTELPDEANLKLYGGNNISTTLIDGALYITYTGPTRVSDDGSPQLSGNLDADDFNIQNVAVLDATEIRSPEIIGDLTGLVNGIDVRDINVAELDFGRINYTVSTTLEFFMATNDLDYGSFATPANAISDFGTFV